MNTQGNGSPLRSERRRDQLLEELKRSLINTYLTELARADVVRYCSARDLVNVAATVLLTASGGAELSKAELLDAVSQLHDEWFGGLG